MKQLMMMCLAFFSLNAAFAATPSPVGEWIADYEDTQVPGAKLRVTLDDQGLLNAYMIEAYAKPDETIADTCVDCPGNFKDKPLKNLPILWNLKPEDGKWVDGQGLSIERKMIFAASAWLSEDGNTLFVRGKVGLLRKTQEWQRVR